jgi:Zn-dependent M28 family amino/carboxypeptidase
MGGIFSERTATMTALFALLLALAQPEPPPFPFAKAEAEISVDINVDELKAHVYRLASPEFLGRKGPGAARASQHIADLFKKLPLQPGFGKSYFQPIPNFLKEGKVASEKDFLGRNVAAILPGTDPKLKDEWICLSAHFDHLGKKGDTLYPGADDNATGVAMLIEVAERLSLFKQKPKRTIVFVSFDLEEVGLLGSTYFAGHPPLPIDKLKVFMTADMLGRSMANVMDEYVFLLGTESSKDLLQLAKDVQPQKGLKVGRIGADMIGTRSDYGPFRDRKIPFLFFSTGQHFDYHQPSDLPDRIDYHRLQKISLWIADLTWKLANDPVAPTWTSDAPPDIDEVKTIHTLLDRVLKSPKLFPLTEQQRKVVADVTKKLDDISTRGVVTPAERTWMLWTGRLLMATVF